MADGEPSDRELMRRLAAGESEALTPLMERHYRRLYRVALSYLRDPDLALDTVQETFVKAFQNAASWNQSAEVAPWLTRIAVNHAIDGYRKGRRRQQREEPLTEGDHDERVVLEDASPERRVLGRELGAAISRALGALPEKQRAVFVLRHYQELSLDEIATTLGMQLGTVKSSLHRALQHLRLRLERVRT